MRGPRFVTGQDGMAAGTSQNVTKRERAAVLLAEDELSDEVIAGAVDVARRTLARWKLEPDFAALVGDNVGRIQAGMLKLAIAKKYKRVEVLDMLHTKHLRALELRAERIAVELSAEDTPETATRKFFGSFIPAEAITGLFVKKETVLANGMKSVEWVYDAAIVKTICSLEEQAAKELGQWEENVNLKHGGMVRTIVLEDD